MAKYVRVTAIPTSDNRTEAKFHFDILIDASGIISGDEPIFGHQGELRAGGHSLPFVLYRNNQLDYGDACGEGNDRYGTINLREVKIETGQILEYTSYDGSGLTQYYRISQVQEQVQ